MPLFIHVLAIKMGVCWIYAHSLFVQDDNRDIEGLRCTMLEFIYKQLFFGVIHLSYKFESPHEQILWNYTKKALGHLM